MIVDSTARPKVIDHPEDSRLLEIAQHKVINPVRRAGLSLKQTYAQEGRMLGLRW